MNLDTPLQLMVRTFRDLMASPRNVYASLAEHLNHRSYAYSEGILPNVSIFDAVPGAESQTVCYSRIFETQGFDVTPEKYRHLQISATTLQDFYHLILLLKSTEAKNILEIGTSYGHAAHMFALNSPEDAKILTLDVQTIEENQTVASVFRGQETSSKITFKSSKLDGVLPTLEKGSFDFIFIDGDHGYEGAYSDSVSALTLVRPGGVICWHDYSFRFRNGVVRALDRLRQEGNDVKHIMYANVSYLRMPQG